MKPRKTALARRNDDPAPSQIVLSTPRASDLNPARVYLGRLSEGSRQTMESALRHIAEKIGGTPDTVPWHQLRYQHTQALRTWIADKYAPSTANKMLSALRGTLEEAMNLGLMSADDYMRASKLKSVRGHRVEKGRALTEDELQKMFHAADTKTALGLRDRAMLALLYGAGLRRAEAVSVRVEDFRPTEQSLTVHGKGNKERKVYLGQWAVRALEAWQEARGDGYGPILRPVDKAGNVVKRALSDQSIADRLNNMAIRAGVKKFGPHDLRRTFISLLLDAGADAGSIQKLAGHESVVTTMGYDRRGERAKKQTAEKLPGLYDVPA